MVVASLDAQGQPWASMLVGPPGFLQSPDPAHLRITAQPCFGDPLNQNLAEGAAIGLLGIELHTRRRNRMNGTVERRDPDGWSVRVLESFGNCPKYIQQRDTVLTEGLAHIAAPKPVARSDRLDARAQAIVAVADTLFIATSYQAGDRRKPDDGGGASADRAGADVSHRGGKPGFVRIDDERTLSFPDFVGNYLFNTLGNLLLDPRAGLLFIDFSNGDVLYLSGRVEIIWDGAELSRYAGAQRVLRFHVLQSIRVDGALPLRWSAPQQSPVLDATGPWQE
ncbi:pyridoxamine 5'-phosphate oxidase family protein [Undibacterium arcticum]